MADYELADGVGPLSTNSFNNILVDHTSLSPEERKELVRLVVEKVVEKDSINTSSILDTTGSSDSIKVRKTGITSFMSELRKGEVFVLWGNEKQLICIAAESEYREKNQIAHYSMNVDVIGVYDGENVEINNSSNIINIERRSNAFLSIDHDAVSYSISGSNNPSIVLVKDAIVAKMFDDSRLTLAFL